MSEQTEYQEEETSASSAENWRKKVQAEAEAAKARAEEAEAKLAKIEREKAFSDAGIDLNSPKFSYFVKGYEGDITAEAIKAEAIKAELIPNVDLAVQAQAATHASLDAASVGATAVPPSGGLETAFEELEAVKGDMDAYWAKAKALGIFK